jgi:hypothetical protein
MLLYSCNKTIAGRQLTYGSSMCRFSSFFFVEILSGLIDVRYDACAPIL